LLARDLADSEIRVKLELVSTDGSICMISVETSPLAVQLYSSILLIEDNFGW
jgi:hypothetical protein